MFVAQNHQQACAHARSVAGDTVWKRKGFHISDIVFWWPLRQGKDGLVEPLQHVLCAPFIDGESESSGGGEQSNVHGGSADAPPERHFCRFSLPTGRNRGGAVFFSPVLLSSSLRSLPATLSRFTESKKWFLGEEARGCYGDRNSFGDRPLVFWSPDSFETTLNLRIHTISLDISRVKNRSKGWFILFSYLLKCEITPDHVNIFFYRLI